MHRGARRLLGAHWPWSFIRPVFYVRVVLILFAAAAVFVLVPGSSSATRQWFLSALAQSLAALIGLVFLGAVFVRETALQAKVELAKHVPKYVNALATGVFGQEYSGNRLPAIEAVRMKCRHWLLQDRRRLTDDDAYDIQPSEFNSPKKMYAAFVRLSAYVSAYVGYEGDLEGKEEQLEQDGVVAGDLAEFAPSLGLNAFFGPEDFFSAVHEAVSPSNPLLNFAGGEEGFVIACRVFEEGSAKDGTCNLVMIARQQHQLQGFGFVFAIIAFFAAFAVTLSALLVSRDDGAANVPSVVLTHLSVVAGALALWGLISVIDAVLLRRC